MKAITINNMNDGIDVKNDPSVVSEGGVVDCIGFDLTQEGVLKTAQGVAANDISTKLPSSGLIQWVQKVYLGSMLYVLATTLDGLYANGTLIDADVTGRFKALSFLNNIYITNGTYSRRFDGTTAYQWGITPPSTMPTISAGTHLYKTIDTFESIAANWVANDSSCTVTAEAAIIKQGAQSVHFNVAASTRGYSYCAYTPDIDGTTFSTGAESLENDYVSFWMLVDVLANLQEVNILIDIGDGTFTTDYFSYTINIPDLSATDNNSLQGLSVGGTSNVIYEEVTTTVTNSYVPTLQEYYQTPNHEYGYNEYPPVAFESWQQANTSYYTTTVVTKVPKTANPVVDPTLTDQTLSFWNTPKLYKLRSGGWTEMRIPKSMFLKVGDTAKGWSTICGVKIEIATTANGAVNVYFDDLKIVGGSDLTGDYWFMYTWGRMDGDGNIVHESAPSRAAMQVNISGPVNFDRHPFVYSARPLSSDPQVDCGVFYAIGGSLTDFWNILEVADNTTAAATVYATGDRYAKRVLMGKGNEIAPAGTDMVLLYNKIWMIGDTNYPQALRSSDILGDGTLAPESWPTKNAYELSDNHGDLINIRVLNKQLLVKGKQGEWTVRINDPTDYLQVSAEKVSDKGLLAQDGVITLTSSHIYPSNRGFIESNGVKSDFVLPEVEPLIDDNISEAVGASVGLVSYFSYNNGTYGTRTAKVDLYRGKPRFTNLNNIQFDCLEYDPVIDKTYCILNGGVYILDSGYTNEAAVSTELYAYIKSRVYRPGPRVAWNRVGFYHNTGGIWYRLEVYVDNVLMNSFPFMSTTRTDGNFRFGPFSGHDFQFVITGNYITLGTIHFPIRIFHSGE